MSIVEVLFAILVATVGLLGAVAVFPVAISYTRRGQINDAAAHLGRSAVHTFDARGLRRPDQWMGFWQNWDTSSPPPPRPWMQVSLLNYPYGTSFCIDPRLIEAPLNSGQELRSNNFPYGPPTGSSSVLHMFRVSLASGHFTTTPPILPFQMGKLQADALFTFDDDLATSRPKEDRSLPALQVFENIGTSSNAGRRQNDGHYSWMATLVPRLDQRDIAAGRHGDEYVLSIVVFYDRPADLDATDRLHERTVDAVFQGDGSSGGEILLHQTYTSPPNAQSEQEAIEILKLRPNDWVLVAGRFAGTNVSRFHWYRVTSAEREPAYSPGGNPHFDNLAGYEIYATLIGQDWDISLRNPRTPTASLNPSLTGLAQVTIVEGVVAVYEKTIRLDYGVAP